MFVGMRRGSGKMAYSKHLLEAVKLVNEAGTPDNRELSVLCALGSIAYALIAIGQRLEDITDGETGLLGVMAFKGDRGQQ